MDLWATLWVVHKQTHWPWTMILGFFFQAISLYYGAVLVAPDEDEPAVDLWRFHLDNRRRYLPTLIVYTVLGCLLAFGFMPLAGFLSAVYTVGLPIIVGFSLAMLTSALWAQRTIAVVMLVWFGWYFATYLPGFSE